MYGKKTGKSITFCHGYRVISVFQYLLQHPIQFPRPYMPHSFIGRQTEIIKRNNQLLIIFGYKRTFPSILSSITQKACEKDNIFGYK